MTTDLSPDRWQTIRHEVTEYLDKSGFASYYDAEAIVWRVAERANSIADLSEDDWIVILRIADLDDSGLDDRMDCRCGHPECGAC